MNDLLIGGAGAAIIALVASDIFRSLLVPRATTAMLRLGPVVSGALFPVWQAAADRIAGRERQQTFRASLAPLLLVLLLILWTAALIFGFGLIFWAHRGGFAPRLANFDDALFASGSAFATLGVPGGVSGSFARIAVITCSLAGLAIVTVNATFLISIQSGFGRRETLVLRLEAHVPLPPTGIGILETYARENAVARLGSFFAAWEEWAAEVAISHRAFPILLFFRSGDSRCEWLAALGAVLDAAALLDSAVANAPSEARASAHFALRAGARLLGDLTGQFAVAPGPLINLVDDDRFRSDRRRLAAACYEVVDDEQAALARFVKQRKSYAQALSSVASRLRIAVDDA